MPLAWAARLVLAGMVLRVVALSQTESAPPVLLAGRVVDDLGAPVAGARVWVDQEEPAPLEAYSGPSGSFQIRLPRSGEYRISARRLGYFLLEKRPVTVAPGGAEITLVLNPQREVFQSVEVGDSPPAVNPDQTVREDRLSGTEINDVPYPSSHSLRNSLKLIPGTVQDPTGGVHFHGGAEYQTQYTLDGFDITDPISNRFSTLLAVEGVHSVDLLSGMQSPQFGRGSAGTLAILPENGGDRFHVTATNFIPGLDTHGGGVHFGDWTPRAGFSGPLVKGRAWFSDSFNGEHNQGYVSGLPRGQDTNASWVAGNLFHTQINLSPSNILYSDFLSNFAYQSHLGLGPLDPVQTTQSQRSSEWLVAVKDSQSWQNGALLEWGFAWQTVFYSTAPQGDAPYIVSPQGRGGSYFVRSQQHGRRAQLFTNLFAPGFRRWGKHQVQIGGDLQRLEYAADFHRTGYEVIGLAGFALFKTAFAGSGSFDLPDTALALYINDHWQPWEKLAIDAGLRADWDDLVQQVALAPRLSFAYAPFADARTKLTAGYAVTHDTANLAIFSRPLDQQAITTPFSGPNAPGTPMASTFETGSHLKLPEYSNWSAGVERDLGRRISAKVEWLRKRGRDGFAYAQPGLPGPIYFQPQLLGYGVGGDYELTNLRRDSYDEVAVTVRQSFGDQYEWFASYARSRAVSNAVLDLMVDQPLQVAGSLARMPWDAPNRLISWGYLPVPRHAKKWTLAYLVDWRTGFPFPVTSQYGIVAGPLDAHRYPSKFDLNLHIERRFTLRGYRFALRGGCNNVTDHANPTAVNEVIGSPQFLQFFGDEGRHFEFRVRFFGRQKV